MPRGARIASASNLYHIMLRGNGQQQIFLDKEDNTQFIDHLKRTKAVSLFEVHAYCLMGNHVHLLLRITEEGESLQQVFRRFGTKYVYWYNAKYKRVGHYDQVYMDIQSIESRPTDRQVRQWIIDLSGCEDAEAFQALETSKRYDVISILKSRQASQRQISTLTGENLSRVKRITR